MFHKTSNLYCIRDWVDQLHSDWSVCTLGCMWRLPKGCVGMENFKGINFQIFHFHMHPLIESICLKRHSWPRFSFPTFPFCLSASVQNKGVPHTHPALTVTYCLARPLKGALGHPLYFSPSLLASISIFKSRDVLGCG